MKSLDTPCFILDYEEFERSIRGFQKALQDISPSFIIGYSVKTNSLPYCLSLAKHFGCYAEVVSFNEYNLALRCGFTAKSIIYNGITKSKVTFTDAVINGAIVNIDSWREIEWLKELPKDGTYKVGIRLNINISDISPADANCENDNSRFGFSDHTNEFSKVIETIRNIPNVQIAGLHIHRTSHTRSLNFYHNLLLHATRIIKKYNLSIEYLDIGGGYFGIFDGKPTYADYCRVFSEILTENRLNNIKLIVEPGNAITASSFSFLSKVIDTKHVTQDLYFITTDGSRNDIDPLFKKTDYIKEIIYRHDINKRSCVKQQIVSGCTCLEFDRMFSLYNSPHLIEGDLVLYKNVGAYTMCLSPLFIRYFPKVYVKRNNTYTLVRDMWTEKEYVNLSKYYE